ncbi:MAG: histidinol-phosphate transaminase [Chloroflexota bacterium]
MRDGIEKFIQPHLRELDGYSAHRSPETLEGKTRVPVEKIIKLDANENVYGCSPRVQKALASYQSYNIYPDSTQTELRKAIASYAGVGFEAVVVGNGSGEILDLIFQLLVGAGDDVMNFVPTFDMYRFRAQLRDARLVEVRRDEDFAIKVAQAKAAVSPRTKLIIITNPNNPDGSLTPVRDIRALLETRVPVLVDEAYYEFCGETALPLMKDYPNLMVLRTFSKWPGLAGVRAGYGIFPPRIADYLLTIKLPYNVSAAAQVAVLESFKDMEYLKSTVNRIITERERLISELKKLGWLRVFPSKANFVLCVVLNGKAGELREELQRRGILVRFWDRPLMRDFIRISVGKPEHSDALIKTLREIGG